MSKLNRNVLKNNNFLTELKKPQIKILEDICSNNKITDKDIDDLFDILEMSNKKNNNNIKKLYKIIIKESYNNSFISEKRNELKSEEFINNMISSSASILCIVVGDWFKNNNLLGIYR